MKVLITGATGMIGGLVLRHCLDGTEVHEVVCLVRRSTGVQHEKLTEIIISDFLHLDDNAPYWNDVVAVYYCQGVYTGAIDRDTFRSITVEYPDALARILVKKSPNVRFCLLSGAGADRSEKSRVAFAKDKGTIENRLIALKMGSFHSFRPGYIYPVTPRQEPSLGYRILRALYPILRLFGEGSSIRSTDLARAMYTVGLSGHDTEILENTDIANKVRS